MVKSILVGAALAVLLSGCGLFQSKPVPCKPVEVLVPVMVKPVIPTVERPTMRSPAISATSTVEDATKSMQIDIVELMGYTKRLEAIMKSISGEDTPNVVGTGK